MKRTLLVLATILLSINLFSQNYNRAIGFRLGSSIGISYKQFLAQDRAVETIFDLDIIGRNSMKVKAACFYQYHFDVKVDGLSVYAGPGASAGVLLQGDYKNNFAMSIDGIGGIEYKFNNVPVVLAFDWNPKFQFVTETGFKPGNFGLTVRYSF